jgi:hypothetical protein
MHFTSDAQFSRFVRRQIVSCAHINNFALGIWRHYTTRTLHNLTETIQILRQHGFELFGPTHSFR